jgi:predicted Zn-dependent protease
MMRRIVIALLIALSISGSSSLAAHEGLHEQIAEVTRRLEHEPRNASLFLKRGELYRLHAQWSLAARDYDRAAALDPQLAGVDLARGLMLFDSGRTAAALVPLQRYVRTNGGDAQGHLALARAFARAGRPSVAAAELGAALEGSAQKDPDVVLERVAALRAAGRPGEALQSLDAVLSRMGPVVTLQLAAIEIEVSAGRYDAALKRVDDAAAASPRKETWLERRGDILMKADRVAEAHASYQAALDAVMTLPPGRRATRAIADLERRLRSALIP